MQGQELGFDGPWRPFQLRRDSMILCLKVKFLPFYTPTEVEGMYRMELCPSKKQSVESEHLMFSCSLAASSGKWIALHKKRGTCRHSDLQ